jgi:thymidylate kinase
MNKMGGIIICFTGIDGSGKTTLAKKFVKYLRSRKIPAQYIYSRYRLTFTKPIVYLANRVFLRNYDIHADYSSYTDRKREVNSRYRALSKLYRSVLYGDYILQLLIKVRIPLLLNNTVVCDRFVYDTVLTDFAVDMDLSEKDIFQLIKQGFYVIPEPKLTFLIDVPEDVALRRKDDIPSIDYLTDRREKYRMLTKHYNIKVIDGDRPPEDVFSDCIREFENEFNI